MPRVQFFELGQRLIDSNHVEYFFIGEADLIVEQNLHLKFATPFLFFFGAGIINQYLAHNMCGDAEKLRLILPFDFTLPDEPQVSFVNQSGRLKSLPG